MVALGAGQVLELLKQLSNWALRTQEVWVGSEVGMFSSYLESGFPPGLGVHLALGDLSLWCW